MLEAICCIGFVGLMWLVIWGLIKISDNVARKRYEREDDIRRENMRKREIEQENIEQKNKIDLLYNTLNSLGFIEEDYIGFGLFRHSKTRAINDLLIFMNSPEFKNAVAKHKIEIENKRHKDTISKIKED